MNLEKQTNIQSSDSMQENLTELLKVIGKFQTENISVQTARCVTRALLQWIKTSQIFAMPSKNDAILSVLI